MASVKAGGGDGDQYCSSIYLAWEDVTVVLPTTNVIKNSPARNKKLLNGLTGYAEPGRIVAIMGPSGSGKSTLLDSLSGRLSANLIMSGDVLLNGKRRSTNSGNISYVTQEDAFLGTLTVRETIAYSAHLRLPTKMSKEEINGVVEMTITDMGLEDCAEKKIGNWHLRGISSGEKKRLSIGLEILTAPHVLFLDEPTSSLDSASAFYVIKALKNIASDGKIVVCSVHQPSSELFNLFDDLFLLSGGEAVYFGEAKMAVKFFADAGFPCPTRKNPADHFLRCISSDFDVINATLMQSQRACGLEAASDPLKNLTTTEIRAMLVQKYRCSEYSINTRRRIQEAKLIEELVLAKSNNGSDACWWKQLCTLTHRSSLNMYRDLGYYWLRFLFYICVSASLGTIFYDIGRTYWEIVARGSLDGFIYGFMLCLSIAGLPSFIEEMKVSHRERFNGHYGEAVFVLSNLLSSFPFLFIISLSSGTILHYMVKFHPGFSHLAFFCINLLCCIAVVESCMMVTASLVPNLLMGIGTGVGVIGILLMASNISRPLPDLPKLFWHYPVSYISFASWGLQGHYKNDMIGLNFESRQPGDPKMKGEMIIQTMFGVRLDHSKWWDLTAVICLLIFYRLLFCLVLKYKDRASSLWQKLYAKTTLQQLGRKPSSRRGRTFSSKRHHHLHSLPSE
ncbi:ABC transporter G family member 15-like [Malania oleifera]|uniref:ABC transporter G family member 15-like n=1 Tax=Malania oleifera TaxID=397392 RepID=UPI0025ADD489|nr:ABC transporter G family member 15-like [Malania oleifera]